MANKRQRQTLHPRGRQGPRTTHVSRSRREAQRTRRLYIGMGIAAAAVVLILAVGFTTEFVIRPRQVLASVNNENITRQDYWRTRGVTLIQQIDQYSFFASVVGGDTSVQYRQAAAASQQELNDLWGSTNVNQGFLQQMVDDQIYVQYLDELGLEISDEELNQYILAQFQPENAPLIDPTETPTLVPERAEWATETAVAVEAAEDADTDPELIGTPAAGTPVAGTPVAETDELIGTPLAGTPAAVTPDNGTPLPAGTPDGSGTPIADGTPDGTPVADQTPTTAPTPDPAQALQTAEAGYSQFRNRTFESARISEAQYRDWVARPALARQKVQDHLVGELGQRTEQIQGAHILVGTEELARELHSQIQNGADFETLAREQSIDTATAVNGGDLGWFTEWDVVEEFWEASADTPEGSFSEPFETRFGWHIVSVEARDGERAMTDAQLDIAQNGVVENWLQNRLAEANVDSGELDPTPTPADFFNPPVEAPPTPTPPDIVEATPIEGTPVTDIGTPVADVATPVADVATSIPDEATPIAEEATPDIDVVGLPAPPAAVTAPGAPEPTATPTREAPTATPTQQPVVTPTPTVANLPAPPSAVQTTTIEIVEEDGEATAITPTPFPAETPTPTVAPVPAPPSA